MKRLTSLIKVFLNKTGNTTHNCISNKKDIFKNRQSNYIREIAPIIFLCVVVGIAYGSYSKISQEVFSFSVNQRVILLDAGHGGWDPGKTGTFGDDEKDINLKITDNLQLYLENSGAIVFVTRNKDEALADKKRVDLFKRAQLSETLSADLVVSIHQNSYPSDNVKGSQVFYYHTSEKSKQLAEKVQQRINEFADTGNKRNAKENNGYYMLKKTRVPSIIVECGFLSNWSDEKKLNTPEYQERMAWAIYMGIEDYFQSN